jgi:hypothetical protein
MLARHEQGLDRSYAYAHYPVAMNYVSEISTIEARLKGAGKPVAAMLREADVSASQWQRWKTKGQTPHRPTWSRIVSATEKIVGQGERTNDEAEVAA